MSLYAFRIVSKRPIYFLVRLISFWLVYFFFIKIQCFPCNKFSAMFFLCFLFNVVLFYCFSFSPMTFDVALRYVTLPCDAAFHGRVLDPFYQGVIAPERPERGALSDPICRIVFHRWMGREVVARAV